MRLRLSDSYMEKEDEPALEVVATMLNINYGHNMDLLNKCKPLLEYAQFVEQLHMILWQTYCVKTEEVSRRCY